MKCRVFEQSDGHLIITLFAEKCKFEGETDQELMDRCTKKLAHKDLPYIDIDPVSFPERKYRNKWRMSADKKNIVIDRTLETVQEVIESEKNILDAELAKAKPDPIILIRCQRNIEKLIEENKKPDYWFARKKDTKEIVSRRM